MKTYLNPFFCCLILLSFSSCQSAGDSANKSNSSSDTTQVSSDSKKTDSLNQEIAIQKDTLMQSDTIQKQAEQADKKETTKYEGNFVVSFFSKGGGIDSKMFNRFKTFIESFNQKNNTTIKYKVIAWGKEGEKDFCFESDNNSYFNSFITDAKNFLAESKLVRIKEHSACRE